MNAITLPDINPARDFIGEAALELKNAQRMMLQSVASNLTTAIEIVAKNSNFTRAQFYADQRIGTNGARFLQVLGAFANVLASQAPELINDTIANAGKGLTVNPDGTVTVA